MKILKLFSSENLKKNLKNILDRFPVTIVIILITAGLFFTELHFHNDLKDVFNKNIVIAILSLILTFIFSIWVYLSTENNDFSKIKKNIFQLIPIIFGIWFFFTFTSDTDNIENIIFFILSLIWIISYLFFAPYAATSLPLGETEWGPKQSVFYTYFYNISVVILITFILGWVMFALWAIWIWAVDALFDLHISWEKTYGNWAILSLAIIAPLFALTQIPKKKEFRENHFNENMFFSFLTKFVAIPFITIYFLILYAYSIKVLMNFGDWPKWEVTWMVIWFSVFGYITYIYSYIFEKSVAFIKSFRKVFPYIVIPQIFMLFYAIYLRINQYDLTINRYFVVVFGLWLLVISIYYIFSKKKHLSIIPAILTLFTIIISVGPWSVYSLPESRQLDRLKTNLEKAWIFKPEKPWTEWLNLIIPLKNYSDIDKNLSKDIYSGISFLCDFDSCNKIKNLFPEIYSEIVEEDKKEWEENNKKEKYEEPRKWQIVRKITEKIKVKSYFYNYNEKQKYFEYSKNYNQDFFPIELKWYSKIYRIQNHNRFEESKTFAEINWKTNEIVIKQDWIEIEKINISEICKKLLKKYWKENNSKLDKQDLTFEIKQNWKNYKIMFENISVKNPDYKEDSENINRINFWNYSNWYILVK